MSYDSNFKEAYANIKEQFKDTFDSFPEEARKALIEKERQLLHNKWLNENLDKSMGRSMRAKEMAKNLMKSSLNVERIGGYLPSYKRRKSVSISIEESCEFPHVEKEPTLSSGAHIFGFRKKTILGMKKRILNAIEEAESYENVTKCSVSYMYFKLFNNGKVIASTRSLSVYGSSFEEDVDRLFEEYDKIINKINECVYGYEKIFTNNCKTYTTFYMTSLYFPSPKSVLFWGKDIPEILNCEIFSVFTANDIKKDCIEQCSNFLWKGTNFSTLDQIIEYANGNICIVCPQTFINHVQEIRSYSDIRVHPDSPIKTLSVIDPSVKYLIHFKEHIGVLFNFTQQKKNVKFTRFTPLSKFPKVDRITVCFDIEAYFDPEIENKQTNIPYLCCVCFTYNNVIGNVIEFEGRDCVSQMIEYIVDVCGELNIDKVELIAHNGGAYDFHYLLSSMYDPSIIKNILLRNNNFISFTFKYDCINFSVKDSYSFLLCSLSSAAKAFLSGEHDFKKTDFPHHEVKTVEDLQKTYRKWRSIDSIIDVNIEKEKLVITSHNIINYDKNKESKLLIDWAKEYCCNDVIVLAKVWLEFKNAVFEIFNSKIVDQSMTLAGMSFKLFEANVDAGVLLFHPKKEDYMNMRDSLIGGRCISVNGIYENVLCLDVKSLYPASMAFYEQPYGKFRRVKKRVLTELGIYYVQVTPNKQSKSSFFPVRYNNKIIYNNFGEQKYNAWYTSVDIDIGISEGHNIKYIPFDENNNVGYSWEKKGKIFKDYIQNVLYKLKLKYEMDNNKVKRNVIKIIMNSLWGKFAQKWLNTEYGIKADSDIDFDQEEAYKIWDTDFMLIKKSKEPKYSSKPVQNGVFTLSWARYHMKKIWDASVKDDAICIYSDTDSLCVKEDNFNLNSTFIMDGKQMPVIGTEIGQLELECKFDKLLCAGKKQYMGFYTFLDKNNEPQIKEKKRFKGVPASYITPELYVHLLSNESKIAQISFLKFRREWGSVKGYIESKNVRAT